jgi:hypothetical protein
MCWHGLCKLALRLVSGADKDPPGGECLMVDHVGPARSRATLIKRFDGSAFLLTPKARKIEFEVGATLENIQSKGEQLGLTIVVEHLHGRRRLIQETPGCKPELPPTRAFREEE